MLHECWQRCDFMKFANWFFLHSDIPEVNIDL